MQQLLRDDPVRIDSDALQHLFDRRKHPSILSRPSWRRNLPYLSELADPRHVRLSIPERAAAEAPGGERRLPEPAAVRDDPLVTMTPDQDQAGRGQDPCAAARPVALVTGVGRTAGIGAGIAASWQRRAGTSP
jgi:hypothetical protein